MADYAKKTNAELQEILKSRNLPTSGKKAELVARLNESDQEAAEPQTEPEPEATSAEPAQPEAIETAPPEQPIDPISSTAEAPPEAADKASPDTTLAAQTNYSLNLPTSSLDNELAKRKARAERFGTAASAAAEPANGDATAEPTQPPVAGTDVAALKNLERAKRFGTGQTAINKLDEALPSDLARGSRKRGHAQVAEANELDDPGLKRGFANRGRGRGGRIGGGGGGGGVGKPRGGGGGGGGAAHTASKPQGIQKTPAYTSEKDKQAAEARRKKFATA